MIGSTSALRWMLSVVRSLYVGEAPTNFGLDHVGPYTFVHPVPLPMSGVIKHVALYISRLGIDPVVIGHFTKTGGMPCGFSPVKLVTLKSIKIGLNQASNLQ